MWFCRDIQDISADGFLTAFLKTGDTVTIKNYWGDVKYKVVSKVTRSPNDGQDMYIDKGKDKLTLITCVSDGKGGFNRCVVICER